jgi:hypothetical protein
MQNYAVRNSNWSKVHCDKLIPGGCMAWTMDMNMFMVSELLKAIEIRDICKKNCNQWAEKFTRTSLKENSSINRFDFTTV